MLWKGAAQRPLAPASRTTMRYNITMFTTFKRTLFVVASFALPLIVKANHTAGHAGGSPTVVGLPNPIKYNTINEFLGAILNIVVQMGAVVIVFFFVYAGFMFVTAQGNTEKIQKAKSMFVWVVVGAFVLLGVYVIRAAICGTLTQIGVSCQL